VPSLRKLPKETDNFSSDRLTAKHQAELDIPALPSLGEIRRRDEDFAAIHDHALCMPAAGIAQTLELLTEAVAGRPRIDDLVQIVATGPEVSGVANRDTSVVVSDLFSRAEASVVVIGYAVYQGQKVFQSLATRMSEQPGLKVKMYLDITRKPGDTSMESELIARYCHQFRTTQWPGGARLPEVYYDPRSTALNRAGAASLHA
jgi:hypothetical protein